MSFRDLDRHFAMVPRALARQLSEVAEAKGRQEAFRRQNPSILKTLTEIALVQSVEASNAIENITAPHRRIEELVAQKTIPRNRSEEEIAGYRDVLNTIHSSAPYIPINPGVIQQLHRDLYQFSATPRGKFKASDNLVEETLPDGTTAIRFRPVGWFETPAAVEELCTTFDAAREAWAHEPLLLVGAFILDFLVIHPFRDGNGRMSRLLTLLLLYQSSYEVGRFVSLEKLVEDSKETYYEALKASTAGWHEAEHDLLPWLSYFLGILTGAYREFEARVGAVSAGRGAKADLVKDVIRSRVSPRFSFDDIRKAAPGISEGYIQQILTQLRKSGAIRRLTLGRSATWERVHTKF